MLASGSLGVGFHFFVSTDEAVVVPADHSRQLLAPTPAPARPTATGTNAPTSTIPPAAEEELLSCSGEAEVVESDPEEDWQTIVLDPRRGIDPDFRPSDVVTFDLASVAGEIMVREIIVDDLTALVEAAAEDDAPLTLVSGFRTYDRQDALYEEGHEELGDDADETIAHPGHSEHQLGTAVDVLEPGMVDLVPEFGETASGQWVQENAHRFGFVISYPDGQLDRVCYSYEPWHLRYVGRDLAEQITESGLPPREWMLLVGAEG